MDEKSAADATEPAALETPALDEPAPEEAEKPSHFGRRSAEKTEGDVTNDAFEGLSNEDLDEIDSVDDIEDDTFANLDLDWEDEEIIQEGERKRLRRWVIVVAAVLMVVTLSALTLWWLFYLKDPPYPLPDFMNISKHQQETQRPQLNSLSPVKRDILKEAVGEKQTHLDGISQTQDVLKTDVNPMPAQETSLETAFRLRLAEISRFRNELLQKQKEIRDLQQDYRDRIRIVEKEILDEIRKFDVKGFDEAIKIKAIEYGLRTIQRREIYINNLNIPHDQLHFANEELLFLERLSDIQLKMQPVVKGIKPEELTKRIDRTLQKHRDGFKRLTVQTDHLPALDLKLTWEEVLRKTEKEEPHPRGAQKVSLPQDQVKANSQILEEISKGEFSRKRYLTWLSPEGANALSKWSGKVLYLNGLSDLHALTAEKLAKWQGDWLCLNGLMEISPETAEHLARWKGKRLSLNGVKSISQRTAKELSSWQGMELEMVGLTEAPPEAIGYLNKWARSEKKIYLSKNFRILKLNGP